MSTVSWTARWADAPRTGPLPVTPTAASIGCDRSSDCRDWSKPSDAPLTVPVYMVCWVQEVEF
jgi:hypothetical protein